MADSLQEGIETLTGLEEESEPPGDPYYAWAWFPITTTTTSGYLNDLSYSALGWLEVGTAGLPSLPVLEKKQRGRA